MLKGFDSETKDSQSVFRKLISAIAYPGSIEQISSSFEYPEGLHSAAAAILLTLLDFETPFWSDLKDQTDAIRWIQFHTGAPVNNNAKTALFALCTDCEKLEDPEFFNCGTLESPDLSATLLIQSEKIATHGSIRLTGPGIKNETFLTLDGIPANFLKRRSEMFRRYPLGVDMLFVHQNRFVAIPRTTFLETV